MLKKVTTLVRNSLPFRNLRHENISLKKEIKELKEKLQHRHTEINDLRFAKKELVKKIEAIRDLL